MKNKGFTLIELLGVILILAILMILVMPKIINSLKSSSEKVDDVTLKMIYTASELYISEYENIFKNTNGNTYCIPLKDLTGEGYLKSPINVNDKDITDLKTVQVTYNDGFEYELKNNNDCETILVGPKCIATNSSKSGSTKIGTRYKCRVNGKTTYNFNVLSTEGTKVNLLMSENINDEKIPFAIKYDEDYGYYVDTYPVVADSIPYAMSKVEMLTENWGNISNLSLNYNNGYGTYSLKGKARLPKYEEIAALCSGVGQLNDLNVSNEYIGDTGIYRYSCPAWITNSDCEGFACGYWTMDVNVEGDGPSVWAVSSYYNTLDDFSLGHENYPGDVICDYSSNTDTVNNCGFNEFGIRPVITVQKSDLG